VHQSLIAEFRVGEQLLLVRMHGARLGVANKPQKLGSPWSNKPAPFPTSAQLKNDAACYPRVTRINHYISVCLIGVMSSAEAWAWSMSSLTQLVCTLATPVIA
jgi:hypothetical protein